MKTKMFEIAVILILIIILAGCSNPVQETLDGVEDGVGEEKYTLETTIYSNGEIPEEEAPALIEITPDKEKYAKGDKVEIRAHYWSGEDEDGAQLNYWRGMVGDETTFNDVKENPLEVTIEDDTSVVATYGGDPWFWWSSGYTGGYVRLFENPDYSDTDLFLKEDELSEITPQVREVADIINDNRDVSTLTEIVSLLHSFSYGGFDNYYIVSAAQILTAGKVENCGHFATAFATLAKAKGIPAYMVEGAGVNWIRDLDVTTSHFVSHVFVEVKIDGEWLLVDPTNKELFHDYDSSNWFLPGGYVGYKKFTSQLTQGVSEPIDPDDDGRMDYCQPGWAGQLMAVAFFERKYAADEYVDPGYPSEKIYDDQVRWDLEDSYEELNLVEASLPDIDYSGKQYHVEADDDYIDFTNIN